MTIRRFLQLIAVAALLAVASVQADAAQYRWTGVDRVIAVSDPHGDYDAFATTLKNAGVIDGSLHWAAGNAHFVLTGDMLDRGPDSRDIMDLVMRLETEAPAAGGMVHLTLGNHEVMNLIGDLRYVSPAEFAAFADLESADERERWFQAMLSTRRVQTGGDVDEKALRAEFNRDRPPGFYGHRHAFSSQGKYGAWLLQKPLLVVVDGTAFVHGGLSEYIAGKELGPLNDELRSEVTRYVAALEKLYAAGLLDPAVNFYEQATIADGMRSDATIAPDLMAALDTVVELGRAPIHLQSSPLWYRGNVGCSQPMELQVVDNALAALEANRVVIGHTPTVTRQVLSRFGGRVIEIDTGMFAGAYHGSGHALVMEAGKLAVVGEHSGGPSAPIPHPRRVGARADALSAADLEKLLATGNIGDVATDDAGRQIVEISDGEATVTAMFVPLPRRSRDNTELAAYRLDRLLDLQMVPVTVSREVNGQEGTLQFFPGDARDEAYRAAGGQGGDAWCPILRQWNSMYIFDVLIHNEARQPTTMVYSPQNWQLLLMGHTGAFDTGTRRPRYLASTDLDIGTGWVDALNGLDKESLTASLGDVLSRRQIDALLERRDQLLRDADDGN